MSFIFTLERTDAGDPRPTDKDLDSIRNTLAAWLKRGDQSVIIVLPVGVKLKGMARVGDELKDLPEIKIVDERGETMERPKASCCGGDESCGHP